MVSSTRRTFLRSSVGLAWGFTLPFLHINTDIGWGRIVAQTITDLGKIRERLAKHFFTLASEANQLTVFELMRTLKPDGNWPDIQSDFPTEQAGIKRYAHCTRILKLAGAFYGEKDVARREQLLHTLYQALSVWLGKPHPPSAGWFYQIGSPLALGQTAILMGDNLRDDERFGIVAILKTCVRPDGVLDYSGKPATGENLMHEAIIQVLAGLLSEDVGYLARYAKEAETEIGPGRTESIQVDFSFHQHGPQLYSGGLYGVGFARDASFLAMALHKTPFAFTPEKIDSLTAYVLDGLQPLTRGQNFDFTTMGRMVAWPHRDWPDHDGHIGAEGACDHLMEVTSKRATELKAFSDRLRGDDPPQTAPIINRLFWMSDYMTHQRSGFQASARMSSRRVYSHESGGKQNELGYHLGDGAMCLMRTGDEYQNIFPLWDWRKIPGVSCVYNPDVPFPKHDWGKDSNGGADFAGGVSDGYSGAAAMELNRAGLRAKKAWFFLDNVIVCLGTDIIADNPHLPVITSVNQCWSRGAVRTSQRSNPLTSGSTFQQMAAGWVHHDGVMYLFPQDMDVRIRTEHKSAPWSTINTAPHREARHDLKNPTPDVVGEVFALWIEHGKPTGLGASYSYMVAPGLKVADVGGFHQRQAPKILTNATSLQAVAIADTIQCVFWQPGALEITGYPHIQVDQPTIVQLRRNAKGWTIAAGNPTHQVRLLRVQVNSALWKQPVEMIFNFPSDAYAGQSQVKMFPKM